VSFHWVAAALLSFGITYLVLANQIILDPWSALDAVNSRTLPQIYGLMLCLAVLVLWMQRRRPTSPSDRASGTPAAPPSLRLRPLLLLSTLILGFIVALNWLNLWMAVGGLVLGLLWVMQERRWSILIGASLALPIGGFLLVERLLQMSLPIS
jgi:4-hydroxybenzoate polyprenyltransferase